MLLVTGNPCHQWWEGLVAISVVLLEGVLTFNTYLDKQGGGRVKSEDFRGGTSFMDDP